MELADRTSRLLAAIIDRALYLPFFVIAVIILPGTRRSSDMLVPVLISMVLLPLALFVYQAWLVSTTGQTIGKKYMNIRIVKVPDLSQGGFVSNFLLRVIAMWALGAVPVVGTIIAIANPFFIFRDDRRCIHDHLAGTCVIKA
jgi:uncharacterized RDD family membrane protein YckC